jgi:DNA-binding transcriptional ArsR family regulator
MKVKLCSSAMSRKARRPGLTPEVLEIIAARFRVLGEASRLKLILALEDGEKNVTRLVELTGLTQANVSRHLQTLTSAGILGRRKEGFNVIYYIADESIFELCDQVCGSLQKRLAQQARAFTPER